MLNWVIVPYTATTYRIAVVSTSSDVFTYWGQNFFQLGYPGGKGVSWRFPFEAA
jgi:hypothetical protein